MKNTTSLARKTAAFAAAMMIVLSGAGTAALTTGTSVNPVVMTASAADTYKVTQQTFGMKTPANSVKVYHGNVLVQEATWENLLEGFTVTGANNTVVLEYDDGNLTFDVTGHLIENTRESGISREEFHVSYDTVANMGVTPDGNTVLCYVISTARNAQTGRVGVDLYPTNAEMKTPDLIFNEKNTPLLTFDYEEGTDIYLMAMGRNEGHLMKYDMESQTTTGTNVFIKQGSIGNKAKFAPDKFIVPDGFDSVTVQTSKGIVVSNNDYGYADNSKSVLYTPAEWTTGKASVDFSAGQLTDAINEMIQVKFHYENGSEIFYSYLCDTAYMDSWNFAPTYLVNADNIPVTDNTGKEALDGRDENTGNPIVTDEVLGVEPQEGDYTVTVFKGAEPIETMTGKQFENGKYEIPDYSPDDNYYVKVEYADGSGDYKMFRYNDEIGGAWEQRVDTKETPEITLPVDLSTFPEECAGGFATENGKTVADWSAEEFTSGAKELTVPTKDSDDFGFTFSYPKGSEEYVLVGIDPELKNTNGSKNYTPVPVDTTANAGDKIHVTGTTEDGKPVDFEKTIAKGEEDKPVLLPDGTYTVANETTGIRDEVTADGDNSENSAGSVGTDGKYNNDGESGEKKGDEAVLNLTTPENINHFRITAPDGTLIDEGSVEDGVFDNIADVNAKKEDITGQPYVQYEFTVGQTNSTDPEALKEESGYVIDVDVDGDFVKVSADGLLKGDMNLDGKVSLKDVVMMQKYLHGKEVPKFASFINADMNDDGNVNVFDFCLLKKVILNKK